MADKAIANKRWSVTVSYHNDRVDYYQVEELEELQDIIESGPDFSYLKKIEVKYNFGA